MKEVITNNNILNTFILFIQAGDKAVRYAEAKFKKNHRLSVIQFMLLITLSSNGHTMKPSVIAKWLGRQPNNVTTIVNSLEKRGLVKSERSTKDKRTVNVALTDEGQGLLIKAKKTARIIVKDVMVSIPEEELLSLNKSLRTLRDNSKRKT